MLLKHAWKELEPRFALLFLLNLSLGLSGLVTMEAFRHSLSASLRENSRQLMGADLALVHRRPLTPAEQKIAEDLAAEGESQTLVTETFSMVKGPAGSRLTLLRAVGVGYPLRGYVNLQRGGVRREGQAEPPSDALWLDEELARQLGVKIGGSLRVGEVSFRVDDFITLDPTVSFRALTLAGRIMLSQAGLSATQLLRPESTVSYVSLFRLTDGKNAAELARAYTARFPDPAIRVQDAREAAEDSTRSLAYLGDFLGLSALVALFLSALGSAYLFRTWLVHRSRVFAVHQVLGLSFRRAALIPALQITLLSAAAVPPALILSRLELSALTSLISSLSPVAIGAELSLSAALVAFVVAALGSGLLALPFLYSLRSTEAKDLLGGKIPEPRFDFRAILWFVPAAPLFYALAVYEAQSFRTAGIFFASLLGSLLCLLFAGALFLRVLRHLPLENFSWPLRQATRQLSRRGLNSLSAFVAIALGTLLLNLLPQLRAGLLAEMEGSGPRKLPSLFLFDIQDDQLSPLEKELGDQGLALENVSPLVRARLLTVNSQPFERLSTGGVFQTREEETEARFRNRGYNLSYRTKVSEAEEIVAGRPFGEKVANEISLEERFAARVGLKLGDLLLFDVQGVEISGRVVNLRKVRWTSFQPNFFVTFQDGVLNDAPKIFLGSLRDLPTEKKDQVQSLLAEKFPNISVVDVRATVNRVLALTDRMRWSLNLMSGIALFAGFIVLFAIANRQAELRRWDVNLCKVLGAGIRELRAQQLWESGLLAFFAASFGGALSVGFGWVASLYLFEGVFHVAPAPLFLALLTTTLLAMFTSWLGTRAVWQRNAAELLQEQSL